MMQMLKKIGNTSSSNNALLRTMLDPAMQMKIYIDPTYIRRVTLLSAPTPTPLSTRDTQGVQTARRNDTQAVLTEAKDTHSVMAEAHQPSYTDATSGAHAQAHEPTKRKRRKRNRKNSHVQTDEVMAVTCESVEERKERLSEEAERAEVQAHAPDVERIADDEDTADDEAFKEQERRYMPSTWTG